MGDSGGGAGKGFMDSGGASLETGARRSRGEEQKSKQEFEHLIGGGGGEVGEGGGNGC